VIRDLRRLTMLLVFALMLGAVLPSQARAIVITVGGNDFDVVFFQGPASFNDNIATLTDIATAPWWGSAADALAFADAYATQVATFPFDLSGNIDFLAFAHANDGANTFQAELDDTGGTGLFSVPNGFGTADLHYAYVNTTTPSPRSTAGRWDKGQ